MKSGNLNFLEPSGPLQACNGTDLPFHDLLEKYKCTSLYKQNFNFSTSIEQCMMNIHAASKYLEVGLHGLC